MSSDETAIEPPITVINSYPQSATVSAESMLSQLSIGALIQVSTADNSLKYLTRLIGADSTRTLITPLPSPKQLKKEHATLVYDDVFYPDRPLIMRVIEKGTVFAFQSPVIAINYTGSKLLLSKFPKTIQSQKLRNDARIPCSLTATVEIDDKVVEGIIVDISRGGCLMHCNNAVNLFPTVKQQNLKLVIRLSDKERSEKIKATIITSKKISGQTLTLSLAFNQSSARVNDYLDSLQLGEMEALFI